MYRLPGHEARGRAERVAAFPSTSRTPNLERQGSQEGAGCGLSGGNLDRCPAAHGREAQGLDWLGVLEEQGKR